MDIEPLLEQLRKVSNDDLQHSLREQHLKINDEKFHTAFLCVAASHDLSSPEMKVQGPPGMAKQVIYGDRLRASVVFMVFTALCYMRSEHLERGLDDVALDSPLRPFRDIYRTGCAKLGEDTLVQHIRNAMAHGTFRLERSPEIQFIDRQWQELLTVTQVLELCEHVHRLYHEAFSDDVPRPSHWEKYGSY